VALLDDNALLHVVIDSIVLCLPVVIALGIGKNPPRWRDLIDTAPDSIQIVLAGGVGISLWPVAWWIMSIINSFLNDQVGFYLPTFAQYPNWGLEVIQTAVIAPLAVGLLLFGYARYNLAHMRRPI